MTATGDHRSGDWGDAERDKVRRRLAGMIESLPGAEAQESYGHTAYVVRGKRFAWLLVDHHGDGRLALCVKAPPGEQEALIAEVPGPYFVPAYLGSRGWVGISLVGDPPPDWDEAAALLEQAWRMTAGVRAVRAFDAASARGIAPGTVR